jgi:hypothetical protein
MADEPHPLEPRHLQLKQRQMAGLLLLALAVLVVVVVRARLHYGSWGELFPPGWWRW